MRQLAVILIGFMSFSATAFGVPVYLAPDRQFPSGHYNREWLKEHTDSQVTLTWLKVRTQKGKIGWILKDRLVLNDELNPNSLATVKINSPLRKLSSPTAEVVAQVSKLESVTTISAKLEEWGRISLRNKPQMWWPMNEEHEPVAKTQSLLSSQLFKRGLFDMASSPIRRELKLASAQGIYRTTNGKTWEQIPQFRDQDHPIAISDSGRIFVGPYYSDDNGVTFNEYIRWDKLLSGITRLQGVPGQPAFKILEVKPTKLDSQKISVLLDIGNSQRVAAYTSDLGLTWSLSLK